MTVNWTQGLARRQRQHALVPRSTAGTVDVVRRLLAVRGWPPQLAELSASARQRDVPPDTVGQALLDGSLIRSYSFRGGSYVFTPEIGAILLSVRTATGIWQTTRWQKQGGFSLDDWEPLREVICGFLSGGPKTRAEISAHLADTPGMRNLRDAAKGAGSDSLYKPLHWWGDICFGPVTDGATTFRLLRGDPAWPGPIDVDEAGRRAVRLYLESYGPATEENLLYWLNDGLGAPRRQVMAWLAATDTTTIDLDGTAAYLLTEHRDELEATLATPSVRLLPGYDPWVMGPGTADPRLVPQEHRGVLSRGANIVTVNGVVAGT